MIDDDNQYTASRSELLEKPTNLEYQVLSRIARIDDPHQPTLLTKNNTSDRTLMIHYHHEQRFATFRKDVHRLWTTIFENTPINDSRLIVGHRNNRNTKRELIHLRPHAYMSLSITKLISSNMTSRTFLNQL